MTEAKSAPRPDPKPAKATAADVAGHLLDGEMPLTDLVAKTSQATCAAAWAAGLIELGRTKYCVTGNPGIKLTREGESPSGVIIEGGTEWSGPKTREHATLAEALAKSELPTADRYRKYATVRDEKTGEEGLRPVALSRAEAVEATRLRARLTDKGLALLAPAE